MNEVLELLSNHSSVREFLEKPVENGLLKEMIQAGQQASTSNHIQAYSIIRVKDQGKKRTLAVLAGNQSHVETCPVLLIFCADLNRLANICQEKHEKFDTASMEAFLLATVDTSLIAQSIMIAAESEGLGGVYIGGIRNNPQDVCTLLDIPQHVYPVFGMCLGYPKVINGTKPRLPLSVVLKEDSYTTEREEALLRDYDQTISNYYKERTSGVRTTSWTEGMAAYLKQDLRPHMKNFLLSKGFEMK